MSTLRGVGHSSSMATGRLAAIQDPKILAVSVAMTGRIRRSIARREGVWSVAFAVTRRKQRQ